MLVNILANTNMVLKSPETDLSSKTPAEILVL